MKFIFQSLIWIAALAVSGPAVSDTWPAKPIRVIVPYSAGGAVDVITRIVTEHMSRDLGQPIVVEPRPGGEGSIAALAVARAAPDGYTLLSSSAVLTSIPLLFDKLNWGLKDFVGVGRFATSSGFIIASAKLPVQTLPEFVDYAKKNLGVPSAVLIGGAYTTFVTRLLAKHADIDLLFVKYQGAAQHMVDLYEGRVGLATVSGNLACTSLANPRVRVLATTGEKRSSASPGVPTVGEVGYPQIDPTGWYGLHAPTGTPRQVIDRLADALDKALQSAEVKEGLAKACVDVSFMRGEAFETFVRSDVQRWERAVKDVGTP